jgi:hypothetical protein
MMSVADALQGNTFLRTIRLTLDNQEHRWAHLKEEAFVRLLAAVQLQQSNVINFSLPSTSFFDILDVRGPGDADHPGKYDLATAARIVTLGRAMASNRTEMIRKDLQICRTNTMCSTACTETITCRDRPNLAVLASSKAQPR